MCMERLFNFFPSWHLSVLILSQQQLLSCCTVPLVFWLTAKIQVQVLWVVLRCLGLINRSKYRQMEITTPL